jgi:hypothetical protein
MKVFKILLTLFFLAAVVSAQEQQLIRDQKLNSSCYFKMIGAGDARLTILALPQIYSWAIRENMALDAVSIPALAVSNFDKSSIIRLTNTKLRLSYNYQNLAIGTFGLKIPMGINQFSTGQEITAGLAATRQLGVRFSDLYNTFDISMGASSSTAFKDLGPGDLSMGLGLAMLFKTAFTPQEGGSNSFSPGNEFNVSLASEYAMIVQQRKVGLFLDLGFTIYGSDKMGDKVITKVGNKFDWALQGNTDVMQLPVQLRLANFIKGANTIEKIGETTVKSNDLIISLQAPVPVASWKPYQPYGRIMMGNYSGGSAMAGSATVFSLAGGGAYRLNEQMFLQGETVIDMGGYTGRGVFGVSVNGGINYNLK